MTAADYRIAESAARHRLGGVLVMLSMSGFWMLSVINGAPNNFSHNDLLLLGGLAAAVLSAQAAICFLLRKNRLANWATAAFSAVNIVCCYLLFWSPFVSLSAVIQIIALLIVAAVAFALYSFLEKSTAARRWTMAAAGCLLFYQAAVFAVGKTILEDEKPPPGMTSHSDIRLVEFNKFPNVYVLSFDALIPRSLAGRYLLIDELPYQDYMEEADFHVFRNSFVDAVFTEKSLALFLGMGTERFPKSEDANYHAYAGAFTGKFPSPLVEIFQANGYAANSYFKDASFGDKGAHMDEHHVHIPFSTCGFLDKASFRFGFWGYCNMLSWLLTNNVFGWVDGKKSYGGWLSEQFARATNSQRRSFSIAYIWSPGHVFPGYVGRPEQFNLYRELFNNRKHEAADYIRLLTESILENDSDALIFIFGDHGARLTNETTWQDQKDEKAQAFFIRDNYAVLSAVYPKDACPEWHAPEAFITPAKVGRMIVRCLSGEDPFLRPPSYPLDYDYQGYTGDTPLRYEDYLYE